MLGLDSDQFCDLDVFVSNADDYFKFFNLKNDFCCYFALFSYPEEVFAAFSSILIRIYVNICLKFFSHLDLNVYDEQRIKKIILTQSRFFLARFWHEVNIDFLNEISDIFDKYNKSYCFRNRNKKVEFGHYYPAAFDATITFIAF